jgi:PadR family transcriptional regulator PadR
MARTSACTPQGTLDLLILRALADTSRHGLGIARRVEQMTAGEFRVPFGSLFPALRRLEEAGWLAACWDASEHNRKAKFYTLTRAGRKRLDHETAEWQRLVVVMTRALEA